MAKVEHHPGELYLQLPNRAVARFYNKRGTAEQWIKDYWLLLVESHLTRRLFGAMLRRIWALPVPT